MKIINLHEPRFDESDEAFILETLRSSWVSTGGPFVEKFEKDFAYFVGSKFAISVCNGTVALSLSLEVLKRQRDMDEPFDVVVPSLTFIATINSVFHANGRPFLVDNALDSLNIDLDQMMEGIKKYYRYDPNDRYWRSKITNHPILAIMPAHIMGYTCDMQKLKAMAEELKLPIIEDAAEALGSYDLNGKHVGTSGIASGFSFNGNKILTTGGGGMIVTNDAEFARRAKHLSTTAKMDPLRFTHDEVGYNYRLVNPLAALGCSQLPKLKSRLDRKKEIFHLYSNELGKAGISVISEQHSLPNHWIVNCRFSSHEQREHTLMELNAAGIMCRPLWTPAHRIPYVIPALQPDQTFPNGEAMWNTVLSLPSSPHLANSEIADICKMILATIGQ